MRIRFVTLWVAMASAAAAATGGHASDMPSIEWIRHLPPAPKVLALPGRPDWRPGVVVRNPDGSLRLAPAPVTVAALPPLPPSADRSIGMLASRAAIIAYVRDLAPRFGLDPELVLAMIAVESGFNANAVSPRGARGLMQLIPGTAQRFGVADSFNPVENIRGGMSYMRWLMSYFQGDLRRALAAYNAGEGAVDQAGGIPPFAETKSYILRILERYQAARQR
jgi:soluble lytic murein transglycosylase-like protein